MPLWHAFKALAWYWAVCGKRNYSFKITPMMVLNQEGRGWVLQWMTETSIAALLHLLTSAPFVKHNVYDDDSDCFFSCCSLSLHVVYGLRLYRIRVLMWSNSLEKSLSFSSLAISCFPSSWRLDEHLFLKTNVGNWQRLRCDHESIACQEITMKKSNRQHETSHLFL